MSRNLVVAGIGTNVGKTIVAAIVTEALRADYWKPVQAGELHQTDTDKVRSLVSNNITCFHPETYRLKEALSPHTAAASEGLEISTQAIKIPQTQNTLVIELAGGIMVPLNKTCTNLDLLKQWNLPVLLVSQNYLGSINHTLLSAMVLKQYHIQTAGIIFNGAPNTSTEEFILERTGLKLAGRVGEMKTINKNSIAELAHQLRPSLKNLLNETD